MQLEQKNRVATPYLVVLKISGGGRSENFNTTPHETAMGDHEKDDHYR
ncbi:MAG: hypothetical protein C5S52_06210 [ANME-2 cluster archaeon]|nr:hypothetical protein [ANME-2 cluster archaeon]